MPLGSSAEERTRARFAGEPLASILKHHVTQNQNLTGDEIKKNQLFNFSRFKCLFWCRVFPFSSLYQGRGTVVVGSSTVHPMKPAYYPTTF